MLKRIKYISRFARPLSANEIEEIVQVAQDNNRKNDLTGALMATGGIFFQIIEGPRERVDELWAVLMQDPRHQEILLLRSEEGQLTRMFPDWSMKRVDLDRNSDLRVEPLKVLVRAVLQQSQTLQEMIGVLERAAWHEMVDVTPRS